VPGTPAQFTAQMAFAQICFELRLAGGCQEILHGINLLAVIFFSISLPTIDLLPDIVTKAVDIGFIDWCNTINNADRIARAQICSNMNINCLRLAPSKVNAKTGEKNNCQNHKQQLFVVRMTGCQSIRKFLTAHWF